MKHKQGVKQNQGFFGKGRQISCQSLFFAILFLPLFFLSSCDQKQLIDTSRKIEKDTWNRANVISFETKVTDTLKLYNIYVNVRNTTDYKYCNLFLFITTWFPDHRKARDTVECTLADAEGKWRGEGFGKIKENSFPLKKGLRFKAAGIYRFDIEQAMRVEELQGIADIGLRIEKQ